MPRTRRTETPPIVDEVLPGLDGLNADPQPVTKRPPGRPRGSGTKAAASSRIAHRAPSGKVLSKAQVMAQVSEEAHAILTMLIGAWGIKDEECAGVWFEGVQTASGVQERLAAVVDRVVALIARSDRLLALAAKGGLFAEIASMGALLMPVFKQVWSAHGPGGHGHAAPEQIAQDYARYPAPSLA